MLDQSTGFGPSNQNKERLLGLWYDPDRLMLEGVYNDEVTAYRARKRWVSALERNFLLEESLDFNLRVNNARYSSYFKVRCDFLTACGRYAFWRLTHHQAPEVQCLLETAHLPHAPFEQAKGAPSIEGELEGLCSNSIKNDSIDRETSTHLTLIDAVKTIQVLADRLFIHRGWFKK